MSKRSGGRGWTLRGFGSGRIERHAAEVTAPEAQGAEAGCCHRRRWGGQQRFRGGHSPWSGSLFLVVSKLGRVHWIVSLIPSPQHRARAPKHGTLG